jgi:hypothetical protein
MRQNILILSFLELKQNSFFKWVNKIFWVAAISVGRSKRGNKQDFILSLVADLREHRNLTFGRVPLL